MGADACTTTTLIGRITLIATGNPIIICRGNSCFQTRPQRIDLNCGRRCNEIGYAAICSPPRFQLALEQAKAAARHVPPTDGIRDSLGSSRTSRFMTGW
jgi:hypothetical protein